MFISNILKKQHRQLASSVAQILTQTTPAVSSRFFSQAASPAQPTPEELNKAKEEWGEQYSDECFQFEKEWKAIADKVEKE